MQKTDEGEGEREGEEQRSGGNDGGSGERELLSTDGRRSFFFPLFLLFSFSLSCGLLSAK
jgi:hypothetical protein